jgi:hypothetical protein
LIVQRHPREKWRSDSLKHFSPKKNSKEIEIRKQNLMHDHSRYWRGDLVPVTAAAAIAMMGIVAFVFIHFVPEKDFPTGELGMITTTVLDKAGAVAIPTDPAVQSAIRKNSVTTGSSTR